jgi:epoxyqueuosine reductase
MDWMAETAQRRADPRALWSEARSLVMLAMNYGPQEDPREETRDADRGIVSVYARHRDYHDVVKGKLKTLAQWIVKEGAAAGLAHAGTAPAVKVFVDTAPVMEKPLAQAAGLGWQGKHTNLVSRDFGSWLFLGSVFTTLDLEPDAPETDHCGACRACLDACPTDAFPAPYVIDARRCVSYLTIESKAQIPRALRKGVGARIYGCDDCLAACPWNKFAQAAREMKLQAREDLRAPRLADLVALDDEGFRALFAGGPIKRIGHARFIRNVLVAIGASGDASLAPHARARLDDPHPFVRGMAAWALAQLLDEARFEALRAQFLPLESDAGVRAEWLAGREGDQT